MTKYKNILDYILEAKIMPEYNERKTVKDFNWIEICIIISLLLLISSGLYSLEPYLLGEDIPDLVKCISTISVFGLIITMFIGVIHKKINYKENYNNYKLKLNKLRRELSKNFDIKEEDQINSLIKLCDIELFKKTSLNQFILFLSRTITGAYVLVFSFVLANSSDENVEVFTSLLSLLIGLGILGVVVVGVNYFVKFDLQLTRKSKIRSLRSMFLDITIMNDL